MRKYYLEFILNISAESFGPLRDSIMGLGEDLNISQAPEDSGAKDKDFKIHICTQDPAIIFDTCAQFGKLKSVKVEEKRLS